MNEVIEEFIDTSKLVNHKSPKMLNIAFWPNPVLSEKCAPVVNDIKSEPIQDLIDSMLHTMNTYGAIGLAANQVGVPLQIIVTYGDMVFINPELSNFEGNTFDKEGCVSFPGIQECIRRYEDVTVKFFDREGNLKTLNTSGPIAKVLQHEYEHLQGKTFLDSMDSIKRKKALLDFKNFKRKFNDVL